MIIGLSLETMGRMSFANGWWRAVCWMMHTYLLSKMLLFSRNQQIFFDHCQDRSETAKSDNDRARSLLSVL